MVWGFGASDQAQNWGLGFRDRVVPDRGCERRTSIIQASLVVVLEFGVSGASRTDRASGAAGYRSCLRKPWQPRRIQIYSREASTTS